MSVPPMRLRDLPDELNSISGQVLDSAIEVQKTLGRHLSEETYQTCLAHELGLRGFLVSLERPVALRYKGLVVPNARRMDILVEEKVVVELKCVERLAREHEAQLMDDFRRRVL